MTMSNFITISLIIVLPMTTIVNFAELENLSDWYILNDGVMGGLSDSQFEITEDGYGKYSGTVSTDNNGGFASVRHSCNILPKENYSKFILKVKGDSKNYQFRVKKGDSDYHSYIYTFATSGEWEIIEIPFSDLYPSFRGQRLNYLNYAGESIEELGILIGNKKNETFELMISEIGIE